MECSAQRGEKDRTNSIGRITVAIDMTTGACPAGEQRGRDNAARGAIPVLSCEGACIRGEIARSVANILSKKEGFSRGCHGELLTVPGSAIAQWIKSAEKVIIVDGCFLKCHERLFKNILDATRVVTFDALSYYGKYTELFDADSVPEAELRKVAAEVADSIYAELKTGSRPIQNVTVGCGSCL